MASSYSQANRPLRVDTVLGSDKLLLTGFSGSEGISTPYMFRLSMMSDDPDITGEDLLRTPASITVETTAGTKRVIHGRISRFVQHGFADGLAFYEAELVPWFWFLSLSRDCHIHQNKTVRQIVEKVFNDLNYNDFEFRLALEYQPREYCVQYRESHLDFVSRLLEEEGIFYFFEHTDSKHTLVLADHNAKFPTVTGPSKIRITEAPAPDEETIRSLKDESAVHIGKVTLRDYDHLQPSLNLTGESAGKGVEEVYDYPGRYTKVDAGNRLARIRLEAQEATRRLLHGQGSARYLEAGRIFELTGHFRADNNRKYLLTQVSHSATGGDYRGWNSSPFSYEIDFLAIPDDTIYRPPHVTPKPIVRGSQTALVVGKKGEEVYVDPHGRVKVQFYWDRVGKKDDSSSCWVRVSSSWAGKGWGHIMIPRMGQEVIVDFLEGDPDLPIITGRVYNAEQTPPWDLPGQHWVSGVRSRSTKNGDKTAFNEISMKDEKGKELLYIHAQKDENHHVENNRTRFVGHDESIKVVNDRKKLVENNEDTEIKANRTEKVGGNEKITIDGNRTEKVGGNENIEISGNRNEKVSGNESIKISGKRTEKVTGAEGLDLKAKRTTKVGANETLKVNANRSSKISVNDTLKVGAVLKIKANATIELKCGGSSIKMTPASITIKSPMIKIQGQAMAEMKAPLATVKGTAMLQAKAPLNQTKGDALLMLKGGITMIN